MDDFPGILARDFGFRPQQGKSAPMSASKSSSSLGSGYSPARSANPISAFDDVFGGPHKHHPAQNQNADPRPPPPSFDSIFDGFKDPSPNPKWSSMPVFDKPVYDDDDIFEGVAGVKVPAKAEYDDVFASISKGVHMDESETYDDLLGGLGRSSSSRAAAESKRSDDLGGFEELIPGFGGSSPPSRRDPQEANQQKSSVPSAKPSATMPDDPFVVLETSSASAYPSSGMFGDPLEHLGRPMNSGSVNIDVSPASGGILDDINAFDGLSKSVPTFAFEKNETRKDGSPPKSGQNRSSMESFDNCIPKTESTKSIGSRNTVQSSQSSDGPYDRNATADLSPKSSEHLETADDVWLTVAEIPLFTQPTSAPPPSRPPPPLVLKSAKYGKANHRRKDDDSYAQSRTGYPYPKDSMRRPGASPTDEFEDFVMNKPQSNEHADNISSEDDFENNSAAAVSAAAMKDAMDKAEAKFKHAKEVRERERDAKSARSGDFTQERDEDLAPDTQDWEDKKKQEKMDRENRERLQREREEREKEQRRLEKEREARQAVERATREARERAAVEARERAAAEARAKAERQAVEKANAEARQRAERAAVQRAQQEARERAAAEAKEKAARAAVERAAAEARQRAERAAVEKANAQARERAAAEAREKAAKERQVKTENDLESFFTTTNRPTSAPKERENRNPFEAQPQNRTSTDGTKRTTSTYSSTVKKTASTPNMVDDLASIFGGVSSSSGGFPSSSGVFQEVEGEPEERRRSRLEKHQRTLERAAKALAEKNERDMQVQREQAERHRIAETLDAEIKRWAAGKEGNLRALLSTLHYVLWPECGWQPVSLTDLIEGSKVKRIYRKANLCIHPDKVQQKGANIQQKYIAEKVFDLLKEAWNKFNSEELF